MSVRTAEELRALLAVGTAVRQVLDAMARHVRPGVSTAELDEVGAAVVRRLGARSAPSSVYGFPGCNCISLNDEAVHGIPGERRLHEGDIVKLDVTLEKDGFMADAARTVAVGAVTRDAHRLMACAERAFARALRVARVGVRVREIGRAVEREVGRSGFAVIRDLCGHGIGRTIHEEPSVPNFADPRATQELTDGLVITIEPIIAAGSGAAVTSADGWTVKTVDRSLSAHYEHTVVITRGTPILLTA